MKRKIAMLAMAVLTLGTLYGCAPEVSDADLVFEFQAYSGPILPLTADTYENISATRHTSIEAEGRLGAEVADSYEITNTATETQSTRVYYPFVSSFFALEHTLPSISVNGERVEAELLTRSMPNVFDSEIHFSSFSDYEAYIADENYGMASAEDLRLDTPVTVYELTDLPTEPEDYEAARMTFGFDYDPSVTLPFAYGGSGGGLYETHMYLSIPLPREGAEQDDKLLIIIVGEDIEGYEFKFYEDGGLDEELEGIALPTVERYESDFDSVLGELTADFALKHVGTIEGASELLAYATSETLSQYMTPQTEQVRNYSVTVLDELIGDAFGSMRIFYLAFDLELDVGETVSLSAERQTYSSYDFSGVPNEKKGMSGYDIASTLGSTLQFTDATYEMIADEGYYIAKSTLEESSDAEQVYWILREIED